MPGAGSIMTGVGEFGLNYFQGTTTEPTEVLGTIVSAVDPFWGGREFMYVQAAGAIAREALVTVTAILKAGVPTVQVVECPNTANLGKTLGLAMSAMAADSYGWVQIGGIGVVKASASVAADTTFGITAAGAVGANSAGKQVLNARCVAPSSTTFVKANCYANNGSKILEVPNTNGWFTGITVTGTGIAASTIVTDIDPSGRKVTLSNATTARVSGNITGAYTDGVGHFLMVQINRPFAQGAIT